MACESRWRHEDGWSGEEEFKGACFKMKGVWFQMGVHGLWPLFAVTTMGRWGVPEVMVVMMTGVRRGGSETVWVMEVELGVGAHVHLRM